MDGWDVVLVGILYFLVPLLSLLVIYWGCRRLEMARGPAILITFLGGLGICIIWILLIWKLVNELFSVPST